MRASNHMSFQMLPLATVMCIDRSIWIFNKLLMEHVAAKSVCKAPVQQSKPLRRLEMSTGLSVSIRACMSQHMQ